jgi:hypothetical protein
MKYLFAILFGLFGAFCAFTILQELVGIGGPRVAVGARSGGGPVSAVPRGATPAEAPPCERDLD